MAKTNEAFQKAEKKIEVALRDRLIKLDLRGGDEDFEQLAQLPASLAKLTWLESLDLSRNQLTVVPTWLDQLTQLKSLKLSGNELLVLPESIRQLEQLEVLHVAYNSLEAVPEWLGDLRQLQELDLSHNSTLKLPESPVKLRSLITLSLAQLKLKQLPDWFGQLEQLQSLNLSGNELEALPESLGQLTQLRSLRLDDNQLTELPECLGQLTQLEKLTLSGNKLPTLPEWFGQFLQLQDLYIARNNLTTLPQSFGQLVSLRSLEIWDNRISHLPDSFRDLLALRTIWFGTPNGGNPLIEVPANLRPLNEIRGINFIKCELTSLPNWLNELSKLEWLHLGENQLTDLPASLAELESLSVHGLDENPINPELAAAYQEGFDAIKRYLRAKADAQVTLNEAKLILIGEGEVGKSCLLGALRNDPWEEDRPTTHGIEIKQVKVNDPESGTEITLNGWDFGGQRVYRPTHQLFFSSPAVYLVAWKPREGPQQGFVKDWIKLVKHREPAAKIIVVATHGGPKERQPDIDRQEIWDLFGKDMVIDFFLVDSKPDKTQRRKGIDELRFAIARVASGLPDMGRAVPLRWEETRKALEETKEAYLPLDDVLRLCRKHRIEDPEEAKDFLRVSHRLGHLIHYEHDPLLRDIVILKPDWLATAISFVLDDENTRHSRGLITFRRLGQLWNHRTRAPEFRYPPKLHSIFLRLMERFDLSYRVPGSPLGGESDETSLIAQLVPDIRPSDLIINWPANAAAGDEEQSQICRITDIKSGQSAAAEGLLFQLIVRLHKYSLGRLNYADSVHWQRGLVLEDDYGARALLENLGNDVRITVRSPYPERFLAALTYEVKWLVENFWAGLRCNVMVPCLNPTSCIGLFEVRKLIENKKRNRPEQPCPVCNEWQNIEALLHNAPASRPNPLEELLANSTTALQMLTAMRTQLSGQKTEIMGRFDNLDAQDRELVSKVEASYAGLMRTLLDEAKEGPRLFSFEPVDSGFFDRPKWISEKFRVTLWCEHSRLPLPALNGEADKRGVYELTMPRDWVVKAAPFLKVLTGTLSLVVPVAASATKFVLDDISYKGIEKQLDLGQKSLTSVLKGGEQAGSWLSQSDTPDVVEGSANRAQGAIFRQLHTWLKEKDPSFGGLVRVQNKRQEFLWVHQQFEQEY